MKLTHDRPENEGVANGIRRARQLTGFGWTPVGNIPAVNAYMDMDGERKYSPMRLYPFFPQKGMIYSSVLKNQKFVGFNVSFETFVTALSDPDSVLYKYNVNGQGRRNANCWYGVVCSCFVSYVLNMKERWICKRWPGVEGVTHLGQPDLEDLKLLDIVLNVKRHIAIITDILRDEEGNVALIEVSESTLPFARATYFTPESFRKYWYGREFGIYRKDGLEKIGYTASPFVRVEFPAERGIASDPEMPVYVPNQDILPDQGNVSNYKEGQEIVLDILKDGFDKVELENEKGEKEIFPVTDRKAVIPMDSPFHRPGFYKAAAVEKESGKRSEPCAYAVTGLKLASGDGTAVSEEEQAPQVIRPGKKVTLAFTGAGEDIPDMIYIHATGNCGERCRFKVTEEDRRKGSVTIAFPEETEDTYFVFMSAANRYGEYASNYLYFKTEA